MLQHSERTQSGGPRSLQPVGQAATIVIGPTTAPSQSGRCWVGARRLVRLPGHRAHRSRSGRHRADHLADLTIRADAHNPRTMGS